MADNPMTNFQDAGRAMSAQLVRMNTTASNLAIAGAISGSEASAYRTIMPVFRTEFDRASGMSTVNVESVVQAGERPAKLYDQSHPLAAKGGSVSQSGVEA